MSEARRDEQEEGAERGAGAERQRHSRHSTPVDAAKNGPFAELQHSPNCQSLLTAARQVPEAPLTHSRSPACTALKYKAALLLAAHSNMVVATVLFSISAFLAGAGNIIGEWCPAIGLAWRRRIRRRPAAGRGALDIETPLCLQAPAQFATVRSAVQSVPYILTFAASTAPLPYRRSAGLGGGAAAVVQLGVWECRRGQREHASEAGSRLPRVTGRHQSRVATGCLHVRLPRAF